MVPFWVRSIIKSQDAAAVLQRFVALVSPVDAYPSSSGPYAKHPSTVGAAIGSLCSLFMWPFRPLVVSLLPRYCHDIDSSSVRARPTPSAGLHAQTLTGEPGSDARVLEKARGFQKTSNSQLCIDISISISTDMYVCVLCAYV